MKLTPEQQQVITSEGNIKINAVAGSGKTTTVIEYAKSRPSSSSILYLAFNKSVKDEAIEKFRKAGLRNVTVETAHSLAYRHVVRKKGYEVTNGYKTHELVELLELQAYTDQQKHAQYILANHVNKYLAYYCNSAIGTLQNLDYLDVVKDTKARTFVRTFKKAILSKTLMFLGKMIRGEIDVTHDFYLKRFQLSKPTLTYDYILFDEGQDASPAMLQIFLNQDATKVIVGDAHQQIYAWRYAVNSLEQVAFPDVYLGHSFRFGPAIAQLAISILQWKKHLDIENEYFLEGVGTVAVPTKTKAVLARTNLGLLLTAIDYVTKKDKQAIYFEGSIHSYTYAGDGTSLYDVLNLFLKKKHLVQHPLIREMNDLKEMEDYAESTEDHELIMLAHAVRTHKEEIPRLIQEIKDRQVARTEAEIIFSTVHRSKGMEYDEVQLVNDFITEKRLLEHKEDEDKDLKIASLTEEINLLYVAITRTKQKLYIPETLVPEDFKANESIVLIKVPDEEENDDPTEFEKLLAATPFSIAEKTSSLDEIRKTHPNAYLPWTTALDDELTVMYCEGHTVAEMVAHFGRNAGAIRSRIKKLELQDLYGY